MTLKTFGIIIGIAGLLHGSAEMLRGSELVRQSATEALPYDWPNHNFYSFTKGSPVRSVLTDIPFYALGLLAYSVSITLIVVSVAWLRVNTWGVAAFAALSLGVFAFGAGEGTPFFMSLPAIIACVVYLRRPTRARRAARAVQRYRYTFRGFYGLLIFSWVLFFPGLFIISFYQEIPGWLGAFAFASMPIGGIGALVSAVLSDQMQPQLADQPS